MYSETGVWERGEVSAAAGSGRVLVVDDDRSFGRLLASALETRGHDVDWAGSVADAIATLYSQHYDLVVIDLRLPDGSGLELLRHATDEGLLTESAAMIVTGADFEEPHDIRVLHKPLDLDAFLERAYHLVQLIRQRRGGATKGGAPRLPGGTARPSRDGRGNGRPPAAKIEIVLYTSPESEKCRKALRAVNEVLAGYDLSQVSFSVCDLSLQPEAGDEDAVVFTPTLVKRGPGARTWIVGNLDEPNVLADLLDVSGVDRRGK